MASKALATIDWSRWKGLEAIPLALATDGDRASPDLQLQGVLPAGGTYAYSLNLSAGQEYRFQTVPGEDAFAERALLVDPSNGAVYWANGAASAWLGLTPTAATAAESAVVSVDAAARRVLLVNGAAIEPGDADPFLLNGFADPPLPVVTPKPVDPTPTAPTANEIFRFVKVTSGMYFYTASAAERDLIATSYPELRFEGPVFVGDDVARDGWVPVYRFANTVNGSYFYTANEAERQSIVQTKPQMRAEGVSFWVPGTAGAETQPVYRLMNLDTGGYLFTANPAEKLFALLQGGWRDEGVAFQSLKSLSAKAVELGDGLAQASGDPLTDHAAVDALAWADLPTPDSPAPVDLFGFA